MYKISFESSFDINYIDLCTHDVCTLCKQYRNVIFLYTFHARQIL